MRLALARFCMFLSEVFLSLRYRLVYGISYREYVQTRMGGHR